MFGGIAIALWLGLSPAPPPIHWNTTASGTIKAQSISYRPRLRIDRDFVAINDDCSIAVTICNHDETRCIVQRLPVICPEELK